jgi:hypothetical protein
LTGAVDKRGSGEFPLDSPEPSLAILIPVLKRPHRVIPVLESARRATPAASVYFIHDHDDFPEIEAIEQANASKEAICCSGNYATKINSGAEYTNESFILTGADDLEFHPGWYAKALEKMTEGVMVVGTNDICNPAVIAGQHATHFLVRREYVEQGTIDEPYKLLHEGYPHEWVDNEFIETARARGVYAHAEESIVEHLHPMAGKAPMDDLYAGAQERMQRGGPLFLQRQRLWQK